MRIGVLGSGEMSRRHVAAAAGISGVEMITRAMPIYNALDRSALRRSLLADASIDAIDICLPTPLHVPTALAAFAAGKHVLCEKPLALTAEDAERVLSAAADSGCVFMVAHVLRFFPAYRHLLSVVRSGTLGRVQRATFTRVSGIPTWAAWLTAPSQSGGAILDLLVHDFDQVVALFGPPSHVEATHIESNNTVHAKLLCDGIPVSVEGGWFSDGRAFAMGFDVEFTDARLVYLDKALTLHRANAPTEIISLDNVDPYREQLRYFIQCCTTHAEPVDCPPEASATAVAIAVAVREQAARSALL